MGFSTEWRRGILQQYPPNRRLDKRLSNKKLTSNLFYSTQVQGREISKLCSFIHNEVFYCNSLSARQKYRRDSRFWQSHFSIKCSSINYHFRKVKQGTETLRKRKNQFSFSLPFCKLLCLGCVNWDKRQLNNLPKETKNLKLSQLQNSAALGLCPVSSLPLPTKALSLNI